MKSVALADAKERLGELVQQAAGGEPIRITLSGKAVAQITAVREPRKRIDAVALRELTDTMVPQPQDAAEWMRTVRDEERY